MQEKPVEAEVGVMLVCGEEQDRHVLYSGNAQLVTLEQVSYNDVIDSCTFQPVPVLLPNTKHQAFVPSCHYLFLSGH